MWAGHRNGAHQAQWLVSAQGLERRQHGGSRGQAIVHHNDHAALNRNGHLNFGVLATSGLQGLHLQPDFIFQIGRIQVQWIRVGRDVSQTRFVYCTNGHFGLKRCAQFAHQHHIQLPLQRLGHRRAHGNCTPGNGQHQWVLTPVMAQGLAQLAGSIEAVLEHASGGES